MAVWVNGYYRKDGTYVHGYWRSSPDSSFDNNWSTKGNVNPYTGEIGTKTSPSTHGTSTTTTTTTSSTSTSKTTVDDHVTGGGGIDTVSYSGKFASHTIIKTSTGYTVKDKAGVDAPHALSNVERLQFEDKKVALDVSHTGNAGKALEFIGAIAHDKISDASIVGAVLAFVDKGTSLRDLFQMVIDAGVVRQLAGSDSNIDLVKLAYRNVVGTEASTGVADSLASTYLQGSGGSYTKADFLAAVAGLELNQNHVDLVGLAQTGVEYI